MWSLQLLRLVHFTGAGTGDVTVFAIYSVSYYLQVCTCHILFTSLQIFHVPIPVHCILSFLRDSLLIILRIVFLLIFSHVPKFIILSLNSLQCAYVTIYISLNGIFHSASAWMSSRFTDLDEKNTFCGNDWETFIHLFCSCHVSFKCCWKTYFRKKKLDMQSQSITRIFSQDLSYIISLQISFTWNEILQIPPIPKLSNNGWGKASSPKQLELWKFTCALLHHNIHNHVNS